MHKLRTPVSQPINSQPPLIGDGIYKSNRYTILEDYADNTVINTISTNYEKIAVIHDLNYMLIRQMRI